MICEYLSLHFDDHSVCFWAFVSDDANDDADAASDGEYRNVKAAGGDRTHKFHDIDAGAAAGSDVGIDAGEEEEDDDDDGNDHGNVVAAAVVVGMMKNDTGMMMMMMMMMVLKLMATSFQDVDDEMT